MCNKDSCHRIICIKLIFNCEPIYTYPLTTCTTHSPPPYQEVHSVSMTFQTPDPWRPILKAKRAQLSSRHGNQAHMHVSFFLTSDPLVLFMSGWAVLVVGSDWSRHRPIIVWYLVKVSYQREHGYRCTKIPNSYNWCRREEGWRRRG